jgi:predicted RNA-binding protein with RPS1 domain
MFVEVEKGIDGMIHISEVSKDFLKNISDKYKVGDEIEAEIIEINDDKEKVKLSIKKIEISKQRAEERENIEKYSVSGDNE